MTIKPKLQIHNILKEGVSTQILIQIRSILKTNEFKRLRDELIDLNEELQSKHFTAAAMMVGRTLELLVYTLANAWGVRLDVPVVKTIDDLRQSFVSVSNLVIDYHYSEVDEKQQSKDRLRRQVNKLTSSLNDLIFDLDNLKIDEQEKKRIPLQIVTLLRDVKRKFSSITKVREEIDSILNSRELDAILRLRNNAAHANIFGDNIVIDELTISEMVMNLNSILSLLALVNENIPKRIGFGLSNEKLYTRQTRIDAVREVQLLLKHGRVGSNSLESLSIVKGMFNRILRKDQWDWHTVYLQFGRPKNGECNGIANNIKKLRQACRDSLNFDKVTAIDELNSDKKFQKFLSNYISGLKTYEIFPQIYLLNKKTQNSKKQHLIGCSEQSIFEILEEVNENQEEPYGVWANWEIPLGKIQIKEIKRELFSLFSNEKNEGSNLIVNKDFIETRRIIKNFLEKKYGKRFA